MKSLFKNPLFYISLFLGFVFVFEIVSIVQANWSGPTAPPPNGQPALPIDQSTSDQTKEGGLLKHRGNLAVEGNFSLGISRKESRLTINDLSKLCFGEGEDGCISSWDELGDVIQGVNFWQQRNDNYDIYYTDGNVGIGTDNPKPYKLNIASGGIGVTGASYFGDWVNIGTSEPPATGIKLNVNGSGYFNDDLIVKGDAAFFKPVIVGTPIGPDHAATKSYVDSLPGSTGDITKIITPVGSGLTGGADEGDVTLKVDFGVVQKRIVGVCANGQFVNEISDSGIECEAPATGPGGSVTSINVATDSGLKVSTTTGPVILTTDTTNATGLQKRVSGICDPGKSIRVIKQDGTVECEPDDVGAGGGIDGSGSANYIAKWKDATNLQNSSIIEDANSFIGIGKNPDAKYKIDVNGFVNATKLCIAGDCKDKWPVGGGDSIWKQGASEEIGLVDTNKKVEIGNVSSSYKLSVAGSSGGSAYFEGLGYFSDKLKAFSFESTDTSVYLGPKDVNGLSLRVPGSIQSSGDKPNYFEGNVNIGGTIQSSGAASNYFAGKVGIGGASGPRGILDVQGGGSDIYLEPSGNINLDPFGTINVGSRSATPINLNIAGDIIVSSKAIETPVSYPPETEYYYYYEMTQEYVSTEYSTNHMPENAVFDWWKNDRDINITMVFGDISNWETVKMNLSRTLNECEDRTLGYQECMGGPSPNIYSANESPAISPSMIYELFMAPGKDREGNDTYAVGYRRFEKQTGEEIIPVPPGVNITYVGGGITAKSMNISSNAVIEGELDVTTQVTSKNIDTTGSFCLKGICKDADWSNFGGGAASGWTYAPASQIIYATDLNAKVGIGTSNPTEGKLQINGTGLEEGLTIINSSGKKGRLRMDDTGYFYMTTKDDQFNGLVVDQNGAVGIGKFPTTGIKLDVGGDVQIRGTKGLLVGDSGVQGYVITGGGLYNRNTEVKDCAAGNWGSLQDDCSCKTGAGKIQPSNYTSISIDTTIPVFCTYPGP